jgi:hypothetical protein
VAFYHKMRRPTVFHFLLKPSHLITHSALAAMPRTRIRAIILSLAVVEGGLAMLARVSTMILQSHVVAMGVLGSYTRGYIMVAVEVVQRDLQSCGGLAIKGLV